MGELFDYRKYVVNNIPPSAPDNLRAKMGCVLEQYAQMPEGRERLITSFAKRGQVTLNYDPKEMTGIKARKRIYINPDDLRTLRHYLPNGQYSEASLNSAWVHEHGHVGYEGPLILDLVHTARGIRAAYKQYKPNDMKDYDQLETREYLGNIKQLFSRGIIDKETFFKTARKYERQSRDVDPEELEVIKGGVPLLKKYYGEGKRRTDKYITGTKDNGSPELEFYPQITHSKDELLPTYHTANPAISDCAKFVAPPKGIAK